MSPELSPTTGTGVSKGSLKGFSYHLFDQFDSLVILKLGLGQLFFYFSSIYIIPPPSYFTHKEQNINI